MEKTNEVKKWMVMATAAVILHNAGAVASEPQVPCLFIFGDSLIDPGNNNNLLTIARVNFRPYGIDFPLGPTGRFSNGKTVADIISQQLGFEDYIPSYLNARGHQILRGVNYASAAAGIRPETGRHWLILEYSQPNGVYIYDKGNRVPFDEQLRNFNHTVAQMAAIIGDRRAAANYLGKCIFMSALGNNDFLNNYLKPQLYDTSKRYSLPKYISLLLERYSAQLEVLYKQGARKIALVGLAPLGCIPVNIAVNSPDGVSCIEKDNQASQMFSKRLKASIDGFNAKFPDAHFIFIDGYDPIFDLITNPAAYGFKVKNKACCGVSSVICFPNDVVCPNRSEYVFWDFAHPSEAANMLVGKRAFASQKPTDAYPFDLRRLAQL